MLPQLTVAVRTNSCSNSKKRAGSHSVNVSQRNGNVVHGV
jgi:hypothetical protein